MGRKFQEQDENLNLQQVMDIIFEEYLKDPDRSHIRRVLEEGGYPKSNTYVLPEH